MNLFGLLMMHEKVNRTKFGSYLPQSISRWVTNTDTREVIVVTGYLLRIMSTQEHFEPRAVVTH